jgi:hypothetical protein
MAVARRSAAARSSSRRRCSASSRSHSRLDHSSAVSSGMAFSAGTTSRRERAMASRVAPSSARVASASASLDAALAAASFLGLRRRGGDAVRAPLIAIDGAVNDRPVRKPQEKV